MQNINLSNLNYVTDIPQNSWVVYNENIYSDKNILHVTLTAIEGIGQFIFDNHNGEIENIEAKILRIIWHNMQNRFAGFIFKDCCVKPNKFHGIILVDGKFDGNFDKMVNKIITEFKSRSTKLIGMYSSRFGKMLWRNGFEKEIIATYAELYGLVNFVWKKEK
ncbi:MAG TPA: hypothetical protein VGK25_06750 [Ignavibacteria bacterium]|jgi:hypothetical protein